MFASKIFQLAAASLLVGAACSASAAEYPIGEPKVHANMEIIAVYLQPVTMDPEHGMRKASESDIHLEADIHAMKDFPTGFAEGDWIPYLQVKFELTKIKTGQKIQGEFMPMIASDGPHYGDNVKLFGPGQYHLKYFIAPPPATGHMTFGRHIDKETGVGPWFKPFTVEYTFNFAGIGKKGGY
ncbi:MAG: hypothetical protein ON057_000386 [Glomeribacter sp. 1016415]|uniref:34 kDa membrane antigen n=1 Tax=Mycoavidus cysteinexigens TaxID=1553431 RepID=A0A2Z6ETK2_9BURK|nr:iron transporter [Mycoavidus cysteinexigens]MCX8565659.1 hypothetical protein [Glomeribacter sp. 1016415]BBE08702.1 34 kDa membrane antigen precursor [Mycoavidus cysteinexigens]GAM52584.1 periplasmic protein p19 involved in high-affinity Fe2+ transport [bacterium endosymbiont of Mortierella elongata FMR23-6]GLR01436.1 membrane protein [Mycoavidus cysteinexigens]